MSVEVLSNQKEGARAYAYLSTGRAKAAVGGAIWAALGSFAPAIVGAAVFTVTSRFLTPAEFGLVALAAAIAALGSALGPGGFGQALIQRKDMNAAHCDAVFWLCMGFGILAYALIVLLGVPLGQWLGEPGLAVLLPVLSLRVLFDLGAIVPNALLARTMAFRKLAMRTTVASLVSAAICLLLLALGETIWALALSQLAASMAASVAALVSSGWCPRFSFSLKALRQISRFGIFASGHRILQTVSLDQLLVGTLLGTAALGLFGFARRIFQILNDLIAGALGNVSYSALSSLQAEKEKLSRALVITTFASSALAFPVFLGLATIAPELVPTLFGAQWSEAVPALQAFCVIGLLSSIGTIQASLINAQGKADWWLGYMTVKQAGTLVVILALYRYGVTALVVGMAAQNLVMWPFSARKVAQLLDIPLGAYLKPFAVPALASALMAAAVIAVDHALPNLSPLLHLAASIAAGAAVYALALSVLGFRRLREILLMITKRRPLSS
ncbi:lipopolysaccharide biosynthesis protein [Mesorhizobium sp. RP14(2022)]|uniref:Lipopolysaccharide biosynthesis protein n=1 Tax=Mesorhizobium liriopis TaxID=2953882 RepID=A0ABT1C2U5_9HYPH|nr:lipopolysaccharide biosynthesis protein [Mesorhizobium liriopis]MCO6049155.1 lipopolysaccharide biosynthesis protein [Mesorhizobium liriopis]